jgi:hypothetical protein
MKRTFFSLSGKILFLLFSMAFFSCKEENKDSEKPTDTDCSKVSYSADVKPIINKSCALSGCHGSGSNNGDLTLFSGVKAKAEDGTLNNRVLVKKDMPPSGSLSSEELAKIDCWIKNGAPEN